MSEEQILEPEQATEEQKPEVVTRPEDEAEIETTDQEKDPSDELEALRQELEKAKAQADEYLDGWQRARAELSNARKRFLRDQEQAYVNAKADVLARLLPVVDDFERAKETVPEDLAEMTWVKGVLLIQRKLQILLDQDGVEAIEAKGQEFNPFLHQAITHEPSETVAEGHVIGEMQKGYRMGDRVLRPSMVRVSSGPAEVETETEAEAQTGAAE